MVEIALGVGKKYFKELFDDDVKFGGEKAFEFFRWIEENSHEAERAFNVGFSFWSDYRTNFVSWWLMIRISYKIKLLLSHLNCRLFLRESILLEIQRILQ